MLCDELAFVYSTTWCHSLAETWYKPMTTLFAGAYPSLYVTISHYADVIMTTMASQITSLTVVYSIVYSDADQNKHQSSASLVFVWGIHRDRWIPRTKGQLRGKCFHLMTSSCWYSVCITWISREAPNLQTGTYKYTDKVGPTDKDEPWLMSQEYKKVFWCSNSWVYENRRSL